MKKIRWARKIMTLLLCGVLLFSDVTAKVVYAENGLETIETEESQEGHIHEEEMSDEVAESGEHDSMMAESGEPDSDFFGVDDAESVLLQGEQADLTQPVITVNGEPVKESYCESPQVTVTDEGGNLASVTVSVKTSTATKEYLIELSEDKSSCSFDMHDYRLDDGPLSVVVTIVAVDEMLNTRSESFIDGHVAGSLQRFPYEANCTEPGRSIANYICQFCGECYYQYIIENNNQPALGHRFGESETVDESSCGGSGTITRRTCTVCGYVEVQKSENYAEGGNHNWEEKSKAATCTEAGSIWKECSVCHSVKDVGTTESLGGHVYGSWETVEEADCATATIGRQESKCIHKGCQEKRTRTVAASHTWSERRTVKEASCTEAGNTAIVCTVCNTVKANSVQLLTPLGHTYEDDGDCTTDSNCARCGARIEGQEQHNLTVYEKNAQGHWQECQNTGCIYTTLAENDGQPLPHVNASGVSDCTAAWTCADCGYKVTGVRSHSLGDWQSDGNFHWRQCVNCDYQTSKSAHTLQDDYNCTTAKICTTCAAVLEEAKTHNFSDHYTYTVGMHYYACTNAGCRVSSGREAHVFNEVPKDCTKAVKCDACGYVAVSGALRHNYTNAPVHGDAEGHYQVCQNGSCEVQQRLSTAHSGGTATCESPAACSTCHMTYGEKNSNNHVSTVRRNVKEATTQDEGYTGDLYCTACETMLEKGEIIPKLTIVCTHNWVQMKDDEKSWDQCSKCGVIQNEKKHKLVKRNNASGHWDQCETCSYQTTRVPHQPKADEIDTDCTTALTCADCGYVLEAAKSGHKFNAIWAFDEKGHWHVCTNAGCNQTSEKTEHRTNDNQNCTSPVVCLDCKYALMEGRTEHNWDPVWEADESGHYQKCLNIGCAVVNRENHVAVEDDHLCTTPVICSVCSWEIEAAKKAHNFGGEYFYSSTGHWQVCQNAGCIAVQAEVAHIGGTATCSSLAVCEICGESYGDKNAENHIGGWENRGYVAPTEETEGYSGDCYCLSCGEILEEGRILDKLTAGHDHVFDVHRNDDSHHWLECRCGMRSEYRLHKMSEWKSDNTHHWQVCENCSYIVREVHVFVNNMCNTCGVFSPEFNVPEALWITDIADCTYTGKAIVPEFKVYDHSTLLTAGVDYTVKYKNNTNVGTATVTITGKGNYTSFVTTNFTIVPKNLNNSDMTVDNLTVLYNNKVQKPVPNVLWGSKKLKYKTDFTVIYPDSSADAYKKAGSYAIVVSGKGNYTGDRTVLLNITDQKLISKVSVTKIANQNWTGGAIIPTVTVKNGKESLTEGTHYQVSYENNVEVGTATAVITGIGDYAGVKRVTFKIVGSSLSRANVTGLSNLAYTGEPLKQDESAVTLTIGKGTAAEKLVQGQDYTVSYTNNMKVGKGTIIFTGINKYKGSTLKKTFSIQAYNIAEDELGKVRVIVAESAQYSKGGAKPDVTVIFDGETLEAGRDYTLTYANNRAVNDGTGTKIPTVTVKGKGGFTGARGAVSFIITARELSSLESRAVAADKAWTGKANSHTTAVTVTDVDGQKLKAGTDYALTYEYSEQTVLEDGTRREAGDEVLKTDIIPVNTKLCAVATAKGGNYSGSVKAEYCLVKYSLAKARVTVSPRTYTGAAIELGKDDITVMLNGQKVSMENYEIVEGSYKNNVRKGTATVTIHGCGENFGGTKVISFKIVQRKLQ